MILRASYLSLVMLVALAACGGEQGAASSGEDAAAASEAAQTSAFCAEVQPKVDSFMAVAEREHPTPDDPRYGGTVSVAGIGELSGGMNAFAGQNAAGNQHQMFVGLMTLIRYDEALEPQPYLARSWEVAPDGSAVTFHLRDDVYWHDGVRTSAYDVAFTYERATDPATAFPNSGYWDYYVKGPEGVEVADSFTVTLHMRPHAQFLDAWRTVAIMPEHLLADVPPAELGQHPIGVECPVGNGPFVFVAHRGQESWTFRANPAFPEGLGGRPFVDRYVYRIIPEQSTLLNELRTGGIDVYVFARPDQAQAIRQEPGAELLTFPSREFVFVGWNTRRPTLADARVRRALAMGVNRREMVAALLQGYGSVANASVPPFHFAYDPDVGGSVHYDPDHARALLDSAGWRDSDGDGVRQNAQGVPLVISIKYNSGNAQREQIAEIMQAQLGEIGVEIQPEVVEFNTLLGQVTDPGSRDFDGFVLSWVPEFRVDDSDLFHSERVDQPYQWSGIQSPELDRYLDTLQLVLDPTEATPLWRDYQEALVREQPYMFLYFPDHLDGVSTRLHDVEMDWRGEWLNIKDWWIDPARRSSP